MAKHVEVRKRGQTGRENELETDISCVMSISDHEAEL